MMCTTPMANVLDDGRQQRRLSPVAARRVGCMALWSRAAACLAGLLLVSNCLAQPAPASGGALQLQFGYHGAYQRYQLAYETQALWDYALGGSGRLELSVAAAAAYWQASSDRSPSSLWQVAVTPTLRWWWTPRYYAELGTGPSYISRTRFADKELSTRLQFNSFAGIGMRLGDGHRLGLRYTHISNASIKRPNPGLNLLELSYAYMF